MSTNMETAIEFANKVRAELGHLTSEQIADLTDGLEADIASSLDEVLHLPPITDAPIAEAVLVPPPITVD